jgi:Protein of unknown function (DUF1559)
MTRRVELLVAVIVVLTGAGLVLTFVLRSHSPAQRVECAMHLQRIGTAIHAFHDEYKSLPSSCIAPGYATWAVQIGPLLPQDAGKSLKGWDLELSYYDQAPAVREGQIWLYYCPARRTPWQLSVSGDVPAGGQGKLANYPGALGDYGCAPTSDNNAKPWTAAEADGALIVGEVLEKSGDKIVRFKSRTTLADLQRGQAYTILLGEKHVAVGDFGQRLLGDGSLYNGDYPASFARLIDGNHGLAQGPDDAFNLNFGSWHPGVCQFLMADGRIHVSANNVSPEVLQKMIPRGLPE